MRRLYDLPEKGQTLPNGAVVMQARWYSSNPDDDYLGIVLCEKDTELVTWAIALENCSTFWGHYFLFRNEQEKESALQDARNDFWKRGRGMLVSD